MLIIRAGSSSVAASCEYYSCEGCSTTSISCVGYIESDMPCIVSALPPYTQTFVYLADVATESVDLREVSFKHLTELKVLIISPRFNTLKQVISLIPSSAQNIFDPLKKLKILRINSVWSFEHPLDDLFRPLVNLEELDLSQTRV